MIPFYVQTLASQQYDGTAFNTFTTAKSIINAADLTTLPPNYLRHGSKLRVKASINVSNIVTTPGTIVFQVMMGSVVAFTTGNLQLSTTANTNTTVEIEAMLRFLNSTGAANNMTIKGSGHVAGLDVQLGSGAANPTVTDSYLVVPTTIAAGTAFDSTVSQILDFWAGFSISNAGNQVQLFDYTVEQLAGGG